jgi:hypothetical protein
MTESPRPSAAVTRGDSSLTGVQQDHRRDRRYRPPLWSNSGGLATNQVRSWTSSTGSSVEDVMTRRTIENLDALQKNVDTLKSIQSMLGG